MAKATTALDLPALFTKAGYQAPDLTDVEVEAIAKKVASFVRGGYSAEEAVIPAAKSIGVHPRKLVAERVLVDDIPGGHYTCVDNGDGTWNILDVPVVGEIHEGEKGAPFDIGSEWHMAALRKAMQRQGDGHWGAVHVNHHEDGKNTQEAGMIRFRRVGVVQYEGQSMSAMYADLLRVPQDIYERIDQGRLRYMSVEIASWTEPEVASLAIMPDETPFFRLPMLTTGKKIKADAAVKTENLKRSPAVALAEAGTGGFILFNLGGPMKSKKNKAALSAEEKAAREELDFLVDLKEHAVARLDDGDDGDDGGDFYLKMYKYAKKNLKKRGIKMDDGGDMDAGDSGDSGDDGAGGDFAEGGAYGRNQQTTGGNSGPGKFAKPPVEQGEKDEEAMDTKEVAKLSAKVDSLEKEAAERKQNDTVASLVAKAQSDLKGFFLSKDTQEKIVKLAKKDLTGEVLADFVSTYKSVATPDEINDREERRMTAAAPAADEPEALAKLAAKGPEAHARGREIYKEFLNAKQSGYIPATMEFARFLDINLTLEPVKVLRK